MTNTFNYFIFASMNDFISTRAASEKLGLSVRRVQALITSGRLPAEKIGNSYVVREQNLKLVEDRPTGRPAKRAESKNGVKKSFKTIFDIEAELAETLSGSLDSEPGDLSTNREHPKSFAEVAAKYIGSIKEGLPIDSSANKEYLKNLGKKSAERKKLSKDD